MIRRLASILMAGTIGLTLTLGCGDSSKSSAPPPSGDSGPRKVSLVLNWFPEAEHGGYYAALVHGLYAEEGLDVEIIGGGVDVPVIALVATRRHQFGVANADDVIMGRAEQANVVSLMAPMQNSPRVIMVHADSGINSLADLRNITLAMGTGSGFGAFVAKRYPLENVKIVPYPGSISIFLNDKNFAQQAYNISEPFVATKNGGNPRNIFVSEYGYNPYTSLLITANATLQADRDTARRMVRASIKGWELYMKDPEKTNRHINSLNPEMGMDILEFGVREMQQLVFNEDTAKSGLGTMTATRWQQMVEVMESVDLVRAGRVKPQECFTMEFLEP
jgi:NitT/TauT family transport system substrate-binding protein